MPSETARKRVTMIERLLILGAVVCLCWGVFVVARAWRYQSRQLPTTSLAPASQTPLEKTAGPGALPIGEPMGRIEVPRLHVSAAVANGDDDGTLSVAIGHLPDTPFPWETGNSALAGHRDTFFRQLRNIRVGDDMRVTTPYGDFTYQVSRTLIVAPDDLSVLDPTAEPTLTLVTCYPFSYVGHAPKRFIVQAMRTVRFEEAQDPSP
jgi:sortase A